VRRYEYQVVAIQAAYEQGLLGWRVAPVNLPPMQSGSVLHGKAGSQSIVPVVLMERELPDDGTDLKLEPGKRYMLTTLEEAKAIVALVEHTDLAMFPSSRYAAEVGGLLAKSAIVFGADSLGLSEEMRKWLEAAASAAR